MPLIHTIDSISQQARLKGTGKMISLPPAFDMLADLSHIHHNKSGKTSHDHARLFASQALTPLARFCSPASETAQIIDWFLKSNDDSPTIMTIARNILMRTGANLKGNLASMDRDELDKTLSTEMEDSTLMEGGFPEAVIRSLTIALGNPPAKARDYSGEFSGTHETPPGTGHLVVPGSNSPESNKGSKETKPDIQSTLNYTMSGALPPTSDTLDRNKGVSKVKRRVVPRFPGLSKLVQHEKPNPELKGPGYAPSSAFPNSPLDTERRAPESNWFLKYKTAFGLPALTCAVLFTIIVALIAAVAVMGAFLGVEIQQNKSLQAQLSDLFDSAPSCQNTVMTTSTFSTTVTTSTTATASTAAATSTNTGATSNTGLSAGAWAGIAVGIVCIVVIGAAVNFLT